jgi:hypothetical protein
MTSTDAIPAFLHVLAIARPDGTGEVTVNGTFHPVTATDATSARQACLGYVQATVVAPIGRPVRVEARDTTGTRCADSRAGGRSVRRVAPGWADRP